MCYYRPAQVAWKRWLPAELADKNIPVVELSLMTMQQYDFDLFTLNLIVVHKQWSTTFSFELIIVRWTETSLKLAYISLWVLMKRSLVAHLRVLYSVLQVNYHAKVSKLAPFWPCSIV